MLTEASRRRARGLVEPLTDLLARGGITPNQLTTFGCLLHVLVGVLVGFGQLSRGGLALVIAASVDGLDGTLARRTGQVSVRGAFLDSTLDRVSEILVFGGLVVLAFRLNDLPLLVFAYAAIGGSLMVSYTRAKSESLGHGTAVGWLGRFERMVILVLGLLIGQATLAAALVAVGSWITVGQRVADVWWRAGEET